MKRLLTLTAWMLMSIVSLQAQSSLRELPVTTINGRPMHYYEVQPKETVYSLSNKLGITREYLEQCNPEVHDGLKAYSILYFPVADDVPVAHTVTHTVERGETLYGLGKMYGISPDVILAQNPSAAEGLRAGQVLTITIGTPGASVEPTTTATTTHSPHVVSPTRPDSDTARRYTVSQGETLYSIAVNHGLTIEQLAMANPSISILRAGDVLIIPDPESAKAKPAENTAQASPATSTTPNPPASPIIEEEVAETPAPVAAPAPEPVKIAVMLPFGLKQEKPDKNAARATEFYRGLLMAVDSLHSASRPIKIYAYDTDDTDAKIASLLRSPEMSDMQVIIAPDNEAQFATISKWAEPRGIMVFNSVLIKDESYMTNPVVMQSNTPLDDIAERAVYAILESHPGYTPVILRRNDGPADKEKFIEQFIAMVKGEGRDFVEIAYNNRLDDANLKSLDPDGRYLFIANSARQAEANKILPTIVDMKSTAADPGNILVIGYPEWTAFRGTTEKNMHQAGTITYSRFFCDPEDLSSRRVNDAYKRWYDAEMTQQMPRMGMLGFDIGFYLINALRANGGDFSKPTPAYNGAQTGYDFIKADDEDSASGWVNNYNYLIFYRPGDYTEKIRL